MTVFTAIVIWIVALICAAPAAIISDVIPVMLNNQTNKTIYACSPFGPKGPYTKTYTE